MSWLSSLFGKKKRQPQQQAPAPDNSEALIREQMAQQKKYQMELDYRGSKQAAEAAQPISEYRREGLLGVTSLLSAGGMGGWSHGGISQGARTNTQGSTYRLPPPPAPPLAPPPAVAAQEAGAMPFELPKQPQNWHDWNQQMMGNNGNWGG